MSVMKRLFRPSGTREKTVLIRWYNPPMHSSGPHGMAECCGSRYTDVSPGDHCGSCGARFVDTESGRSGGANSDE